MLSWCKTCAFSGIRRRPFIQNPSAGAAWPSSSMRMSSGLSSNQPIPATDPSERTHYFLINQWPITRDWRDRWVRAKRYASGFPRKQAEGNMRQALPLAEKRSPNLPYSRQKLGNKKMTYFIQDALYESSKFHAGRSPVGYLQVRCMEPERAVNSANGS